MKEEMQPMLTYFYLFFIYFYIYIYISPRDSLSMNANPRLEEFHEKQSVTDDKINTEIERVALKDK